MGVKGSLLSVAVALGVIFEREDEILLISICPGPWNSKLDAQQS